MHREDVEETIAGAADERGALGGDVEDPAPAPRLDGDLGRLHPPRMAGTNRYFAADIRGMFDSARRSSKRAIC